MDQWVIKADERNFESTVIERSTQTPVVVDFWAPWCAPCRTLGPLLEKLAEEHAGAFVLVKVNVDENPQLSAALNIRSIPMVLGFRDGKVVAEFIGAVPEATVRQFLGKVLPSKAARLAANAAELRRNGEVAQAEAMFREALELDPRCGGALVGLARILADRDESVVALQLLDRVIPGSERSEADRLAAEIRVQQAGGGDEPALRARVSADPANLQARLLLGQVLAAEGKYPEALAEYLELVRRDRDFEEGAARKAMLDIFNVLGSDHETTRQYRSELAKILFS